MNRHAVYFHKNPITLQVFYVGIGVRDRPYDFKSRSAFWHKVVAKYGNPIVEIIASGLSEDVAKQLEIKYIAQFKRRDLYPDGLLVNLTDGGDTRNYSEEVKLKMGRAISKGLTGRKQSEDTKRRISASLKGRTRPISAQSARLKRTSPWGPRSKKVINTTTGEVFDSGKEVAKLLGISQQYMNMVLNGKKKNHTPYAWL